jgi:hypothetical protein
MEEKIKKEDLRESGHVSAEDIELRKFCVVMAKYTSDRSGSSVVEYARKIERYIRSGEY